MLKPVQEKKTGNVRMEKKIYEAPLKRLHVGQPRPRPGKGRSDRCLFTWCGAGDCRAVLSPLTPSCMCPSHSSPPCVSLAPSAMNSNQPEKGEAPLEVVLRARSNSESGRANRGSSSSSGENSNRPRTWSRARSDSLDKIVEGEENGDSQLRDEYQLCGYLYKVSSSGSKRHMPGLKKSLGGSTLKKRWFVYSDSVCKLYYYKQKNDPEPLGTIDISLATFFFDPDSKNEGQFTIRYGTSEIVLDASTAHNRVHWLQQLQTARREFSQRRTDVRSPARRTGSTGRPQSGLIQEDSLPPTSTSDPHHDLQLPVTQPDPDLERPPRHTPSLASALANLLPNAPPKLFKPSIESPKSPTSPVSVRHSPGSGSPTEDLSLGNLGRRLRSSFRGKRSTSLEGRDSFEVANIHTKTTCRKCEELKQELHSAKEDALATRDEYQASREVIEVLQKELKAVQHEKATLVNLDRSDLTDGHVLEILREKDRQIVSLEHDNQKMANDIARLQAQLSDAYHHQEHLNEKLAMLYNLIKAKDEAIVNLTREMDSKVTSRSNFYIPMSLQGPETMSQGTQTTDTQEEALKDALEAYRCQNIFLNKEILELNLLRKHASEREEKLISESSDWEAKFYQIQSKYLLLLNELHSPHTNKHDQSIVSQLLQDVVQAQGPPDLRMIQNKGRDYDEYGFCINAPDDSSLQSKALHLQKQSQALAHQAQIGGGGSWESKWESFLAGTSAKELPHCTELKYLIRGCIPYQYKGKVWRLLIDSQVAPLKAAIPTNYYQDLLARRTSTASLDPASKQIELDLLRTLPNNRHYESFHADGVAKLRRVLLAFSRHNLQVGYCQGLNRLAAIALLFLNEEDAFWCLVYIVEYLMPPDYYSKNLLGSQVDQRVLKDLVGEKLPRLHAHLEHYGLDISLFTFNWFLCVYIDIIPHTTYLTIWDSFLYEGAKVLFRYALAIFKLCEDAILEKRDYMEIFNYLRSIPEPIINIPRLQEAAFNWVNPLSMRHLRNRRAHHLAIVKAELEEVEAVRRTYHMAKQHSSGDRPPEVLGSPDDDPSSPLTSSDEEEGAENAEEAALGKPAGSKQEGEGEHQQGTEEKTVGKEAGKQAVQRGRLEKWKEEESYAEVFANSVDQDWWLMFG